MADTVTSVIRGNLSMLWGRYRPTQGLSEAEIKGIAAERTDFGNRIREALSDVHGPIAATIRELRRVFKEIEKQPFALKMPTAEEIASRVRSAVEAEIRKPWCPACAHLGGSASMFADSPQGPKMRGFTPFAKDWWCATCGAVLSWYANRQERFNEGRPWPYAPPWPLIPKEAFQIGGGPEDYATFTDGLLISPLGAFVREYLESLIGRAILDCPRVMAIIRDPEES